MLAYLSRRLLLAGFTTIVISMLAFFVMEVPPGDAATKFVDLLMSAGDTSSMEHAETIRKDLGLDKPVFQRYLWWTTKAREQASPRTGFALRPRIRF